MEGDGITLKIMISSKVKNILRDSCEVLTYIQQAETPLRKI